MNQEQVSKCNLASQSEPTLPAESCALVLPRTAEKTLKIVNLMLSRRFSRPTSFCLWIAVDSLSVHYSHFYEATMYYHALYMNSATNVEDYKESKS